MADKKISDFTAATSVAAADLFEIENAGGNSRKVTGSNARAYFADWRLEGAGQTATGTWDQAVDGSKATVDFTGLTGTEIMVLVRNVVQANSGVICLRVSVDNGSTFYSTSGDYVSITNAGLEANSNFMGGFHTTNTTSARSGIMILPGSGVSGPPKPSQILVSAAETRYFVASTSPINAVRVLPSAGGNLTGGKIWCLTR